MDNQYTTLHTKEVYDQIRGMIPYDISIIYNTTAGNIRVGRAGATTDGAKLLSNITKVPLDTSYPFPNVTSSETFLTNHFSYGSFVIGKNAA